MRTCPVESVRSLKENITQVRTSVVSADCCGPTGTRERELSGRATEEGERADIPGRFAETTHAYKQAK